MDKSNSFIQKDKQNKADKILSCRINEECIKFISETVNNIGNNIIDDIKKYKDQEEKKKKRLLERRII